MADITVPKTQVSYPGAVTQKASGQPQFDEILSQFAIDYGKQGPTGVYEAYGEESIALYQSAKSRGLIPKEIDQGPPAPPTEASIADTMYGGSGAA